MFYCWHFLRQRWLFNVGNYNSWMIYGYSTKISPCEWRNRSHISLRIWTKCVTAQSSSVHCSFQMMVLLLNAIEKRSCCGDHQLTTTVTAASNRSIINETNLCIMVSILSFKFGSLVYVSHRLCLFDLFILPQ